MKKLLRLVILMAGAVCYGTESQRVMYDIYQIEELFIDQQYSILAMAPPSRDIYVHTYEPVVPVDFSTFPQWFVRRLQASVDKVTGFTIYPLVVSENPRNRNTIFENGDGEIIFRLKPELGYNPFYWQEVKFGLSFDEQLDDFHRWLYDPAHIAVAMTLIDANDYDDYLSAKETVLQRSSRMLPMMMSKSLPEVMTKPRLTSTTLSNGLMHLTFQLPETYSRSVEIFSCDHLRYSPWELAVNRNIASLNHEICWKDPDSDGLSFRYYMVGDATADSDGDGYSDLREKLITNTDPFVFDNIDSDQDGMHDWFEMLYFGNLSQSQNGDADQDGLSNMEEIEFHLDEEDPYVVVRTDPGLWDTDGDGMDDLYEVVTYDWLDPNDPTDGIEDRDHDGLNNLEEYHLGSIPNNWDSDEDKLPDGIEVRWGTDPTGYNDPLSDTDNDGLTLIDEYNYDTNPSAADSDNDSVNDGTEVDQGSNPNDDEDAGNAPEIDDVVQLTLTVGDHSGSESEIYEMTVSGERTVRLNSGSAGNVETKNFTFKRGKSYTVSIGHVGSTRENPDYDYTATIAPVEANAGTSVQPLSIPSIAPEDEESFVPQLSSAELASCDIVVEDYYGILGENDTSSGPFKAQGKTAKIHLVQTLLTLSKTTMTLKHDNQCELNIVTRPSSLPTSDHEIRIEFANRPPVAILGTSSNMIWTTGVAGNFELSAKVSVLGHELSAPVKTATVSFPTRAQILSDAGIAQAMETEWENTLADSTPTQYRERGFMIHLNTVNNTYAASNYRLGAWVAPGSDADVGQGFGDDPQPRPDALGCSYQVASFHTHTPEEFADSATFDGRSTGPSNEDRTNNDAEEMPGFVYDYSASFIRAGHSETNSAQIYEYGLERKALR